MTGPHVSVTDDMAAVLLSLETRFRYAQQNLPDLFHTDGIDPSTCAHLDSSHAHTRALFDKAAQATHDGHRFTDDVKDHARQSADAINHTNSGDTELSSSHSPVTAPTATPVTGAAAQPLPSPPAQPAMMPAGFGSAGNGLPGPSSGGPAASAPMSTPPAGSRLAPAAASAASHTHQPGPAVFDDLDAQQIRNARQIVDEGVRRGMSRDAIQCALMTALTESHCKRLANPNVAASLQIDNDGIGSDHLSVGCFQQQPWWGDPQELMNPASAASRFYDALLGVAGWQELDKGVACQAVQRSAYPGRYSRYEQQAADLLDRILAG